MVGRHLRAASRPRPFVHSPDSTAPVAVSFFQRRTRVGGRRRRSRRGRRRCGGATRARRRRWGRRRFAAGEMSVCSEQVFLSSARARSLRRRRRRHVLSSEEKASFPRSARQLRCGRQSTGAHANKVCWAAPTRPLTKTRRRAAPSERLHADRTRPTALAKTRRRSPFECQTTKAQKHTQHQTPPAQPVPALKDPQKQSSKQDHRSAPPSFVPLRDRRL